MISRVTPRWARSELSSLGRNRSPLKLLAITETDIMKWRCSRAWLHGPRCRQPFSNLDVGKCSGLQFWAVLDPGGHVLQSFFEAYGLRLTEHTSYARVVGKRMNDFIPCFEVQDLGGSLHSVCHVFGETKDGTRFFRSDVEHAIPGLLDQW